MSATATPSERVERIAVLLWQHATAAVDRKTRVTALLQASSEMNRLFCRICTGTDPHWSDAAEDAAFLSKLAMTRAADFGPLAEPTPAELSVECAAQDLWRSINWAPNPDAEFKALVNAAREMHHLYLRWRSYPDPAAADRAAAETAETLYWLAAYRIDTHITGATPDDDTVPF